MNKEFKIRDLTEYKKSIELLSKIPFENIRLNLKLIGFEFKIKKILEIFGELQRRESRKCNKDLAKLVYPKKPKNPTPELLQEYEENKKIYGIDSLNVTNFYNDLIKEAAEEKVTFLCDETILLSEIEKNIINSEIKLISKHFYGLKALGLLKIDEAVATKIEPKTEPKKKNKK